MISSNWRITFDPASTPVVVVGFGQRIEEEPEWPWSQNIQQGPRVRGANTRWYSRGNAASGLSIVSFFDYATDLLAREACLAWQITLDGKSKITAPLKAEVNAGSTYQAAHAAIASADVSRVLASIKPRVRISWRIEASTWSVLPPP